MLPCISMLHRGLLRPRRIALRMAAAVGCAVTAGACGFDFTLGYNPPPPPPPPPDLGAPEVVDASLFFPPEDLRPLPSVDSRISFPCLEGQPGCHRVSFGPLYSRFPVQSDPMKDQMVESVGVERDINGWLTLGYWPNTFAYQWVPNTHDLGDAGTVSKLDIKTVREVARYPSVTCYSLKTGSTFPCDGNNGCCSMDDWPRYQARTNKMPQPVHAPVQRSANSPSRTSVDFNGDLVVANDAPGGQASVTKITADLSQCIDRNHNLKIDTSSDTNGDGSIEVDCNGDGQPDDMASVKGKPCSNNLKQEYYGIDDECVLWTTNVFTPGARARAVGFADGDGGYSDVWVGSFARGTFVRIDGLTGQQKETSQLPQDCSDSGNGPNGMVIDASGIAWAPQQGAGKLCFFDTRKAVNTGVVRDPQWGPMEADGVTADRDQNIWVGQSVARYTPDRVNGFANLGKGVWTRMDGVTGTRIAADSRSANAYFVYSCLGNGVLQIPASTLKVMKADRTEPNPGWPVIQMPCRGVSLDLDQNVWGLDAQLSTRAFVDKAGAITQPKVNALPMGNNRCPAGDSCAARGADPYSDLTGFKLRNFGRTAGTYRLMITNSCVDGVTDWQVIAWGSDLPADTSLTVRAKSGNFGAFHDQGWAAAQWTPDFSVSPAVLRDVLSPNWDPQDPHDEPAASSLMVEFTFKNPSQNYGLRLKSLHVTYRCPDGP